MKLFFLTFVSLLIVINGTTLTDWPLDSSGLHRTNWTGTWQGLMEAYPEGETGHGWNVTLEIGFYPKSDHTCTIWKSVFTENGAFRAMKDYRLCRGSDVDDLYIDEGNNVTIAGKWINDVFVSPFKYRGVFAVSMMRIRGEILEEEILITADDSAQEDKVVSIEAKSIHLMKMRRASP